MNVTKQLVAERQRDADDSTAIDWPAFFFDEKNRLPHRLMVSARKRFGDTADAESAYNYALEGISTDDWNRLRAGYKGLGRPDGFLAITFANLLEEYAVRKYGRKRPPKWIKDLGGMWPRIFEMLCLRRLLPETIVDVLCVKAGQVAEEVRRAIDEVRARIPSCGEIIGEQYSERDPDALVSQSDSGGGAEDEFVDDELQTLFDVLRVVFADSTIGSRSAASSTGTVSASYLQALSRLRENLSIEDDDRLILKLVYVKRQSIAKAARTLGVREHTMRRRHKRLLDELRAVLRAQGLLVGPSD